MADDYIPSLFLLRDYAGSVAREMFPGQAGAEDQLDAARHILAAATASRKYGPVWAERLGQLHEVTSSPLLALRRLLGEAPDQSYLMDTYNNRLGAQLGPQYQNQADLERAILDLVERKASPSYGAGTPVIMNKARGGLAQLKECSCGR